MKGILQGQGETEGTQKENKKKKLMEDALFDYPRN